MLKQITRRIFKTANERALRAMRPLVTRINELEPALRARPDSDFPALTAELATRHRGGEPLDRLLPEAYAVCREASRRVLGMRHYDVQLLGGIALHQGKIAEMRTGEGKTLVATLPAYLNALSGRGVHVVTVNDYLAGRDAAQMGELYAFLGLSTGVVVHGLDDAERRAAYSCDITYGTNNEFGFDYLRDNMKQSLGELVQRGHNFCIVDEVDSVLIDEARTPLIISGALGGTSDLYRAAAAVVPLLERGEEFDVEANNLAGKRKAQSGDYIVDEKSRTALLTEAGVEKAEQLLSVGNLFDTENAAALHCLQQAVKAIALYRRDVDYVVRDGKVVIVDEFTGRMMPGRRWSDGLHQAIEALEGVEVEEESVTMATITFQNLFRMYDRLSGMTGTADTEAEEFYKIYALEVVVIPTNRPMIRIDDPDAVYLGAEEKYAAIVADVVSRHRRGQPCLVGTTSIEKSELLSAMLDSAGIPHQVLNAKQHEREAGIIAQAGRFGAVTIATNMAGRGTDILLGGNPRGLVELWLQGLGHEATDGELAEATALVAARCEEERAMVIAAGGLHIIGSERHESRRIDNQLRGRAGRQGDPGSSTFYLSMEDDLMRIFGGERMTRLLGLLKMEPGESLSHPLLSRAIENAQKKVEAHNFDVRKHLIEYDTVINLQREALYSMRRAIMAGDVASFGQMVSEVAAAIADRHVGESQDPLSWDWESLRRHTQQYLNLDLQLGDEALAGLTATMIREALQQWGEAVFRAKLEELGEEVGQAVMRSVLLQAIDNHWTRHLAAVEHLKEGMGLRGYGQRDPKLEYKRESHALFVGMQEEIRHEAVGRFTSIQVVYDPPTQGVEELAAAG